MSQKVAEIIEQIGPDSGATWVVNLWDKFNNQRQGKMSEWQEVKQYVFATDTSTTSNSTLPWSNKTTLPKLCQIRDNLHANYMSALFPNDQWLKWEGYSQEAVHKDKAQVITAYMENKARMGGLMSTVSKLIYDYIDYGSAFCTVEFVSSVNNNDELAPVKDFIGPKLVRISPEDIVFNPLADSFENSFKIVRSVKTTGEVLKMINTKPEMGFWQDAMDNREKIKNVMSGYSEEDFNKAMAYTADGFGNMSEYFMGDYIEVLEFWGDYYDHDSGQLHINQVVTVVDRTKVIRSQPIQTYSGRAPMRHVGWRDRPDNLWAMGPLDNLVGMQYRIDHIENLKADAMDLAVWPPLVIQGDVNPFTWGPGAEIQIDQDGRVDELGKNLNPILTAEREIEILESKMELYAGAPREAAGIRTPGEKTAFEVEQLQNAAGRTFQEKITKFEVELLEKALNDMLESSHRNFVETDVISVIDSDIGVKQFKQISKEDITSDGIIRPIGARHFAQRAKELQNLVGVFSTPLGQMIAPHTSSKQIAKYIEDAMDVRGYDLFRENVGVMEQAETQSLVNQAQEDLQLQQQVEDETAVVPEQGEEEDI